MLAKAVSLSAESSGFTGLFASKLTPTNHVSTPSGLKRMELPVGVSLLTKAVFLSAEIQRIYRPLREQAHSHR